MAYTLGQSQNDVASGTADVLLYAGAVQAGSLLVAMFSIASDTETVTAISDNVNAGNWSLAAAGPANGLGERPYIYYKYNTLAGTPTVTFSKSGAATIYEELYEFRGGLSASDPLDKNNTGSGTGGASVVLTSVAANALVLGLVVSDSAPTKGAAFTLGFSAAANFFEVSEYLLDHGSAGNRTVDWTGTTNWTAASASFLLTAGGALPPPSYNLDSDLYF